MRMLDLLHPTTTQESEIPENVTVLGARIHHDCTQPELAQFYSNGSLALPGKEPELLGTRYQVKMRSGNSRARWHEVSRDAYQLALTML